MGTPTIADALHDPSKAAKPTTPVETPGMRPAEATAAKDAYARTTRPGVKSMIPPPAAPPSILVRKPPKAKVVAKPPMVLVPLDDGPVPESAPARESLHRARESEPVPTLLKPDFGVGDQPAEEKIEGDQPWSLEGGFQPKEEIPAAPKVRGGTQTYVVSGPIFGELPPRLMGTSFDLAVQGFPAGVPAAHRDEAGIESPGMKEPADPGETWRDLVEPVKKPAADGATVAFKQRIMDVEKEAAEAL